jgi:hypothetical protein
VFFSHNKSGNNTFSHGFSAKRTDSMYIKGIAIVVQFPSLQPIKFSSHIRCSIVPLPMHSRHRQTMTSKHTIQSCGGGPAGTMGHSLCVAGRQGPSETTLELSRRHRPPGMSRSLMHVLWKLWRVVMASRWQYKLAIHEYTWRPIAWR